MAIKSAEVKIILDFFVSVVALLLAASNMLVTV
jgi:hypothetical protein